MARDTISEIRQRLMEDRQATLSLLKDISEEERSELS
jgi:hypothetical protein